MKDNKRIFLSPPWVGKSEREAIMRAFDSGYIAPVGPQVEEFEAEIRKVSQRKYAIAVSSCTGALDLLMASLKVDADTTVIAPTMTFIATVVPAAHRGARLVFVDSDEFGNIDPAALEEALKAEASRSKKTLIIGVDLFGRCCDYEKLESLARKYRARLIIDAAESVGSRYKSRSAGSAGIAAVYSFNGNKIVTASSGGAIVTDDPKLYQHVTKLRSQAREKRKYYHHKEVGYNYAMSNLLAAVGAEQLRKLPEILAKKRKVNDFYLKLFNQERPSVREEDNNWLTAVVLKSRKMRDEMMEALAKNNIESRMWWKPLHMQPVFKGVAYYGGTRAKRLFERGICLPSGTGLTKNDLARIKTVLKNMV